MCTITSSSLRLWGLGLLRLNPKPYTLGLGLRLKALKQESALLEFLTWGGQGDLISRLIMGIIGVTIWVIGVTNLLTKSP